MSASFPRIFRSILLLTVGALSSAAVEPRLSAEKISSGKEWKVAVSILSADSSSAFKIAIPLAGIGFHPIIIDGIRQDDVMHSADGRKVYFQEKIATQNYRTHRIALSPDGTVGIFPNANLKAAELAKKRYPTLDDGFSLTLAGVRDDRLTFSGRMYLDERPVNAVIAVRYANPGQQMELVSVEFRE